MTTKTFPESNELARLRVIKIHERMLNTVVTNHGDKKVAHIVISHGFIIDSFALFYSTI
jgi:hypothetical protein